MAIQNSVNNLLGTIALGSTAAKHSTLQGLNARASTLAQVAHTENSIAGMEEDALKVEENYNAAVEEKKELDNIPKDEFASEWAYNRSRELADEQIKMLNKQRQDYFSRLDTLEKQLDNQAKIEAVTTKGWARG